MSVFGGYKKTISEGDLVLAWITRDNIQPIIVTPGKIFNNRFGSYHHEDMLNLRYGSQMLSKTGHGFIHLLHPTPELWTLSLPHRTQILYTPDIAFVTSMLALKPGSKMIESGTGSGSFTHALVRTVGGTGKVWTYEYHERRFEAAKEEFIEHGMLGDGLPLTITHRDVCKEGFDIEGETLDAHAAFLDLPAPWEAIPHLSRVISKKRQIRLCCFSPCIEQVQRTLAALRANGWSDLQMFEIVHRNWEARQTLITPLSSAIDRLREVRDKRRLPPGEARKDLPKKRVKEGEEGYDWRAVSVGEKEVKGHTSYLTFAVMAPGEHEEVGGEGEDVEEHAGDIAAAAAKAADEAV
ncbi:protein GCD14 [Saitoella complicata NRRL Y-17804]|uniref:tRNA (adenine(58)-N(1))-methyltransferase catalytic subunit TRM61 n=1 Tax=Saitoella complicata (strain BCRC 22490 / CBS 7301 / JCM 7358 / NBRC 10748 / NRRL Y-17804) TaxID=698492 RepID=A0A0E9NSA7_SAICN|nr:protein GCD14 [Saitoella complicata NRRL Y-17804]ODQ52233.1 protein GCD14 [Saitoella complicata NRRL Y-17804]GAO52653.1 hypothetical protein G7K_6725-t1 [Saitoella complicata NRRL Y-17804]